MRYGSRPRGGELPLSCLIFNIREKPGEQAVGGNRGVQAARRDADPFRKGLMSGNLKLYNSKWDLCRNFP